MYFYQSIILLLVFISNIKGSVYYRLVFRFFAYPLIQFQLFDNSQSYIWFSFYCSPSLDRFVGKLRRTILSLAFLFIIHLLFILTFANNNTATFCLRRKSCLRVCNVITGKFIKCNSSNTWWYSSRISRASSTSSFYSLHSLRHLACNQDDKEYPHNNDCREIHLAGKEEQFVLLWVKSSLVEHTHIPMTCWTVALITEGVRRGPYDRRLSG